MSNYEKIIVGFLNEQFGGLMGGMLLKNYLKRYNLASLTQLPSEKQVAFTEAMLQSILQSHLPPDKIKDIIMKLKLTFSLSKSLDSLSAKTGNDVALESINLMNHDLEKLDVFFDSTDKSTFSVRTNISGDFIGSTVLLVSRDEIPNLKNIMSKKVSFADETDWSTMDNPQLLVKTFFSRLVPTMTYEVGATLNKQIWFTEPEVDLEKEKNFISQLSDYNKVSPNMKEVVSKVMSTGFGVKFNDVKIAGLFVFLEQKSPGILDTWMKNVEEMIHVGKKMPEETMHQIAKEELREQKIIDGDNSLHYKMREGMVSLLGEYKSNPDEIIDDVLKELKVSNLTFIEEKDKNRITDAIIEKHFSGSSHQVIALIKAGCHQILAHKKQ